MLVREVDDGHDGWKKAFSDRDVASLDEQLHLREGYTNSVVVGVVTRSLRRQQQANIVGQIPTEHEQDQNDDDVVESTASAFDRAKRHKSRGSQRGPLVVDLDSGAAGGTTRASKKGTQHQSEQANVELNDSRKSNKAVVAAPVEEPKFNCPICMCPFNEEMSTKCGHIFCKSCIKEAISVQAKCPTCRKDVTAEDLIRVFLPTTE
uniref:RING-type domain-containing protein n=1 Tax=Brassica oleracea var. oleracea TaxID=109376 RepID=A0A0D3AF70_BRAOL